MPISETEVSRDLYKPLARNDKPGLSLHKTFVEQFTQIKMKQTVLITGASSGFGKAAVELFHEKGWNVVATVRSPETTTIFSQLKDVLLTRLDVTRQEQHSGSCS